MAKVAKQGIKNNIEEEMMPRKEGSWCTTAKVKCCFYHRNCYQVILFSISLLFKIISLRGAGRTAKGLEMQCNGTKDSCCEVL